MASHHPTIDEPRDLALHLLMGRQLATLMIIVTFVVTMQFVSEPRITAFTVALAVFLAVGEAYRLAIRRISSEHAIGTMAALDVAMMGIALTQVPRPEQFTIMFVAPIAVAAMVLSTRAALIVLAMAAIAGAGMPIALGSADSAAALMGSMAVVCGVTATLILSRRRERLVAANLERSERQLARAEQVADMGSWQWCPSTDELYWSSQLYRLVGRDPDGPPIEYEAWINSLTPEARRIVQQHSARALESGEDYEFDVAIEDSDRDGNRIIQTRGVRVIDELGAAWLVGTSMDVTELRHVEALKDEFVATASHELRTPATIVLGFARTLDDRWDDIDDDARRGMVRQIRTGGERMSRLIEDVLSITRIEYGGLRVEPVPTRIAHVARDAIAELGNPRVESVIADEMHDAVVLADPMRTRQVLYNLIENALLYDRSGGQVTVDMNAESEHVRVQVRDRGPGIAESDRDRIFERFVRVGTGEPGTGLGLYVARTLVRRQGGELWVEGAPDGTGSTFCFTVPREPST